MMISKQQYTRIPTIFSKDPLEQNNVVSNNNEKIKN